MNFKKNRNKKKIFILTGDQNLHIISDNILKYSKFLYRHRNIFGYCENPFFLQKITQHSMTCIVSFVNWKESYNDFYLDQIKQKIQLDPTLSNIIRDGFYYLEIDGYLDLLDIITKKSKI